ncbi:regulatory protein, luxR family [Cyclobacterium xiamenense]|uniref:Regulatory protein, luxR family n=1 Tax=Cyclobacterium xiamenense TaxID=1297121 RepID=A0A1H6WB46_9BACT|nr:helix-turn-helix transcriptional regulator [Cyclobacterium xiamenense]SEJ09772.1 regulatory protein, luxR family [Cyclobacterium xiamenense]
MVNDYNDLVRAFGRQDYLVYQNDYLEIVKKNPLVNGFWTAGKWFSFVANTRTWNLEYVAGDSLEVSGYSHREIMNLNREFVANFLYSEDYEFVNKAIQQAMMYVNERPMDQRPSVFMVFYNRCNRRDKRVLTIQNQNIPLVFDEKNLPYVFANIITDISHLNPTNIPQAVLLNKATEEQFYMDSKNLQLSPYRSIFSTRELEVLRLLIKGYSSRKIAAALDIRYETARTHRKNILAKAQLKNTGELIHFVLVNKIL